MVEIREAFYRQYIGAAKDLREKYLSVKPFPHLVFDNFLPKYFLDKAIASFPKPESDVWKKPDNAHTVGKMVFKHGPLGQKELYFSEDARSVFYELNSGLFLLFLKTLTGIQGLISDPYFVEGGFHCSGDKGWLDVHADFSHHPAVKLERRVNLLLYLNDDWKPEYGGGLRLYDQELKPTKPILPVMNRVVIFSTSDTSYHGHPEPMNLPEGVFRKSIAMYYYSLPTGREKKPIVFPKDPNFTVPITETYRE